MARTVNWSGYTWTVRPTTGTTKKNPGPNYWGDSSTFVSVDTAGKLHLTIRKKDGLWRCPEIYLQKGLGLGRYQWSIDTDLRTLDANAIFSGFTYDWDEKQSGYGEVDIEFTKWGDVKDPNEVEFSVQPVTKLKNKRLSIGPPPYETYFDWGRDTVKFTIIDGKSVVQTFVCAAPPVPNSGTWPMTILWLMGGKAPKSGQDVKVVVSKFKFTPQ